jgi:hypothetical protein
MKLAVFCGISRRQHDSWQELVTLGATYFAAEARVVRARQCARVRARVRVCVRACVLVRVCARAHVCCAHVFACVHECASAVHACA